MKALRISSFLILSFALLSNCGGMPVSGDSAPDKPALPAASCFKVVVSEQGMARISADDLAAKAGISALDPRKLNLYCAGKPVPVLIEGEEDGKFDEGDSIIFYCAQSNPRSPSDVFWLKPMAEGEQAVRYKVDERKPDEKAEFIQKVETGIPLRDRMDIGGTRSAGGMTVSARVVNTYEPARLDVIVSSSYFEAGENTNAKLALHLRRRQCGADYGVEWKFAVTVGGTDLSFKEEVKGLDWDITCEVPTKYFVNAGDKRRLTLKLANKSTYPENVMEGFVAAMVYVQSGSLTYTERAWARGDQVIIRDVASVGSNIIVEGFTKMEVRVFCPQDRTETRTEALPSMSSPGGYFTARNSGPYIAVSGGAFIKAAVEPYEIGSKNEGWPPHPDLRSAGNEADYLIIAPGAFVEAAGDLAKYRALPRRDGETFKTMAVDSQEIYDQFGEGRFGPQAVKEFLAYARKNWKRPPRYVLLAADAQRDSDFAAPGRTIPAYQCETWFSGICGTDNWYAAWSDDGAPEFAIGRLPADSPDELKTMIDKIIAYETESESGAWRRKLEVVAGEARMGPEIDALLLRMFRLIFGGNMPRVFDLEVAYTGENSDYYYPSKKFNAHVIDSINKGALIFTYVGHGSAQSLDHIYRREGEYPIFEHGDVAKLDCAGRSPIMFIVACDSGAFDVAGADCLGEEIVKKRTAPIAVVASSSESHPYGNGILGIEMLPAFFARGGECGAVTAPARASLGEMLEYMKFRNTRGKSLLRTTLDAAAKAWVGSKEIEQRLRVDHQYLYNLLGDPALQVAMPRYDVKVEVDKEYAKSGEKITVSGTCEGVKEGKAVVTFECDITEPLYPGQKAAADEKAQIERFAENNDKVAFSQEVEVKDGKFSFVMAVPKSAPKGTAGLQPGTYYIKVYLTGKEGDAFGAAKFEIPGE